MSQAIIEQLTGSRPDTSASTSARKSSCVVRKIKTKCQQVQRIELRHSHRNRTRDRHQGNTSIQGRTTGWQEELTIEHCDSPKRDDRLHSDARDSIIEDYNENLYPRSLNAMDSMAPSVRNKPEEEGVVSTPPVTQAEQREESHSRGSLQRYPSYRPPLEVWRRQAGTSCPVNNERTIQIERKTILYGQTPAAMARILFCGMAEAAGVTVEELARKVLSCDTEQHLRLLRSYHTPRVPELSQLFDELDVCAAQNPNTTAKTHAKRTPDCRDSHICNEVGLVDNEAPSTSKSAQSTKRTSTEKDSKVSKSNTHLKKYQKTKLRNITKQMPASNICQDEGNVTHTDLVRGTGTSSAAAVKDHECNNASNRASVGGSSSKEGNAPSEAVRTRTRTVIPETESDTSDDDTVIFSEGNYIPPSPELDQDHLGHRTGLSDQKGSSCENSAPVYTRSRTCSSGKGLLQSSPTVDAARLSTPRNLRKGKCGTSTDKHLEISTVKQHTPRISGEQVNQQERGDYNEVLASLLFEKDTLPGTIKDRTRCHKETRPFNTNRIDNKGNCTTRSSEVDKNYIVHSQSAGYNKVLDTLLFGEPLAGGEPDTRNEAVSCTPKSSSGSRNYSVRIVDQVFGSSQEEARGKRESDGIITDSDGCVQGGKTTLSTSQEVRHSPWGTIECDLMSPTSSAS